jgi:outer membrane protein TolC
MIVSTQPENLNTRWLERFAASSNNAHARSIEPVWRFVTTGTSATFSGGKTACIDTRCEIRLAVKTILFGANDTTGNQGRRPSIQYSWGASEMGNCSSGPNRQNAFLPALVFVLVTVLAGCATSKPRFAATSSSEPSQPAAVQAPQNGTPDPTSGAAPEPGFSADVHPVAYQQSVEDIPALPAPDSVYPLDMSTALALVAGKNPQVAYSQARIREAYANLQAANVLWLPTIQTGVSYHRDEGNLQDSSGAILDVNRSSLQAGLGAGAVGAGTTTQPGIVAQFHLVDALFQPKIAERNVWAQQHASDAVLNDQLLEAAVAYQELLRAYQLQAIANETVTGSETLVRLTTDFAKAGQGNEADADRSKAELALRQNNVARSEEAVAVASARLAQVISLNGAMTIRPVETAVTPIDLVPVENAPQESLATALANRPELKESHDLVAAACERLKREKYAPLVPSMLLGASYGGFGGGFGDTIADFNDRTAFDAMAVWQVRNLG